MKKVLLSAAMFAAVGLIAQSQEPPVKEDNAVGINTTEPRATLDVNGDARIQQLEECDGCKWVLVQDEHGVIQKLPLSDFTISENSAANQVGGTASFINISDKTVYVASFNYGGSANYQGVVNSTGIPVAIEYEASEMGNIQEKIISAEGNPNLKLKIPTTIISQGPGTITALLYSDGNYNVPQLSSSDSNQNTYEKNVAAFKVRVKGVAEPATITLKAGGGIPDRLFGEETNGELEHQFVYRPILGPNGKLWLGQNLGAEYARVDSEHFDPSKIGGGDDSSDPKAYGYYYQWQRGPDGHEVVRWSSDGTPTKLSATTNVQSQGWIANNQGKFITTEWPVYGWNANSSAGPFDKWHKEESWRSTNPCPKGYVVPSLETLKSAFSNGSLSALNIPAGGSRDTDGDFSNQGYTHSVWTSTVWIKKTGIDSDWAEWVGVNKQGAGYNYAAANSIGKPVRCVKKN